MLPVKRDDCLAWAGLYVSAEAEPKFQKCIISRPKGFPGARKHRFDIALGGSQVSVGITVFTFTVRSLREPFCIVGSKSVFCFKPLAALAFASLACLLFALHPLVEIPSALRRELLNCFLHHRYAWMHPVNGFSFCLQSSTRHE